MIKLEEQDFQAQPNQHSDADQARIGAVDLTKVWVC